jgi:hypothetical protein
MEISDLLGFRILSNITSSDESPNDPYSNKIDCPEDATALSMVFMVLYISNNGVVRDTRAHELERKLEDRQRK